MRVTGTSPHTQVQRAGDGRPKAAEARVTPTPGSPGAAAVRVSGAGKILAAARAPEVPDPDRIERLRALVESGGLAVDAGAIADAMLREER